MTLDNDAELYAVALVRLAAEEMESEPTRSAMTAKVEQLREQHGDRGVDALVAALARFGSNAAWVIATDRKTDVHDLLDGFALHKAAQHAEEQGASSHP